MTNKGDKVLRAALALSPSERAQLLGALIDSLDEARDPDAPAAWEEEISRRMAQIESGDVKPVPWLEVRDRLSRGDR